MDSTPLEGTSLAEIRRVTVERLSSVYSLAEAQATTRRLLSYFVPGWELCWLTSRGQAPFPAHRLSEWEAALKAILCGRPLAYILGQTEFLGHCIQVRPGVFIPRPETEEWVAWLTRRLADSPPRHILEVGSGTGAPLIALGKAFPKAILFALDRNPHAIALTQENARLHNLHIFTGVHDFLLAPLPPTWKDYQWDLIISNPPYIPLTDRDAVASNVLTYEPHEALFCEDIEFYEKLGQLAVNKLFPGGNLVVELYPPTACRARDCFQRLGLEVRMHRDLGGRWRWAVASLGGKPHNFGAVSGSSSAR